MDANYQATELSENLSEILEKNIFLFQRMVRELRQYRNVPEKRINRLVQQFWRHVEKNQIKIMQLPNLAGETLIKILDKVMISKYTAGHVVLEPQEFEMAEQELFTQNRVFLEILEDLGLISPTQTSLQTLKIISQLATDITFLTYSGGNTREVRHQILKGVQPDDQQIQQFLTANTGLVVLPAQFATMAVDRPSYYLGSIVFVSRQAEFYLESGIGRDIQQLILYSSIQEALDRLKLNLKYENQERFEQRTIELEDRVKSFTRRLDLEGILWEGIYLSTLEKTQKQFDADPYQKSVLDWYETYLHNSQS